MKKSIAGIVAVVVILALIITGIIIGTTGDENTSEPFRAEFTETVLVENGVAQTEQVEKGFITGIAIVFVVSLVLIMVILKTTKKDGSIKCKYDERQDLVRGRGFKYAFFTLLIYNFVVPMFEICDVELPADSTALFMIGAIIGLLVYVIYAIWNEAYFSLNENPKKVMIAFAFIGVFNLMLGVMRMVDGTFLTDGKLTFHSINFLLGIVFVIIFITLAAKQICNKREEE